MEEEYKNLLVALDKLMVQLVEVRNYRLLKEVADTAMVVKYELEDGEAHNDND